MKNVSLHYKGILMLVFAGFFLFCSAMTVAQKSNFSGNWAYNVEKSKVPETGIRMNATKIIVTQDDLVLNNERIRKDRNGEDRITKEIITLDGKECENVVFQDLKRKSIATWSTADTSLTINSFMTFERNGETMDFKSSENWKLGVDGNTLIIESIATMQNGEVKATLVYDKTN